MNRSSPMRRRGPLATSRIPVASTTSTPGRPSAKRAYQASTCSVTSPSSVARHGTMAGTHVRCSATAWRPMDAGWNNRACAASSRVGQRAGGSACLMRKRSPTVVMSGAAAGSCQRRDALDLDQRAVGGVEHVPRPHQGHGGEVLAEVLAIHVADGLQALLVLRDVEDVDRQLDQIRHVAAGGIQDGLDVRARLTKLRDEVAAADDA